MKILNIFMTFVTLVGLIGFVGVGCSADPSYTHSVIEPLSSPPEPGFINTNKIDLKVGIGIAFSLTSFDSENFAYSPSTVSIQSTNTQIADVYPIDSNGRDFIILGVAEGSTEIEIAISGRVVEQIPTTVISQR